MIPVYVASDCIITSLGFSSKENFEHLKAGVIGLTKTGKISVSSTPYYTSHIDFDLVESRFKEIAQSSAAYTNLEKLAILSISESLSLSNLNIKGEDTLLILSTTKGNIDVLQNELYTSFGKDRLYLWESARWIKDFFKMTNTPVVISNACISGVLAIILGSRMIRSGQIKNVVITGVDILSKFVVSGFHSFQALSPNPCRPFDISRDGLNLGEGCGTIILTSDEKTIADSNPILIGEGYSGNDANHISGPSRTGEGLYLCLKQIVDNTLITGKTIDYISSHGTATLYNDEMESIALSRAGLALVPVNSYKGYWGHTLGAAGVIESIAGIHSIKNNLLIQSAGYTKSGVSQAINVIEKTEEKKLNTCLKIASGFGGCNAGVLFYKR